MKLRLPRPFRAAPFFVGLVAFLAAGLPRTSGADAEASPERLAAADVSAALRVAGLPFTEPEQAQMLGSLQRTLDTLAALRQIHFPNAAPPALRFDPRPPSWKPPVPPDAPYEPVLPEARRPESADDLAFFSVAELAALIRARRITSVELTRLALDRLRRYGPSLRCVVTLTEDRALAAAKVADAEIEAGRWRGPLHGIPYGAKDLLATRGIPTTWGASPFTNQVIDTDAAVIQRLDRAGAILVAKLSLGELAMGDTWFGGKTRNPWKPDQGSSGSSAGSAAAVAAGLVPFAIGSETLGSIVSPSLVCGVSGLRPTFGRVPRTGAMTLCWSSTRSVRSPERRKTARWSSTRSKGRTRGIPPASRLPGAALPPCQSPDCGLAFSNQTWRKMAPTVRIISRHWLS